MLVFTAISLSSPLGSSDFHLIDLLRSTISVCSRYFYVTSDCAFCARMQRSYIFSLSPLLCPLSLAAVCGSWWYCSVCVCVCARNKNEVKSSLKWKTPCCQPMDLNEWSRGMVARQADASLRETRLQSLNITSLCPLYSDRSHTMCEAGLTLWNTI